MSLGSEGCVSLRASSQNCGGALSEQQNRIISIRQEVDSRASDSLELSCNTASRQVATKSIGTCCQTKPPVSPAMAPIVCMNCWLPSLPGHPTTNTASALINLKLSFATKSLMDVWSNSSRWLKMARTTAQQSTVSGEESSRKLCSSTGKDMAMAEAAHSVAMVSEYVFCAD